MVFPHGARPDRRWGLHEIPALRRQFGLDKIGLAKHVVGMIGWLQTNKRWDILLSNWEAIHDEIEQHTGEDWDLLAAGAMRDPNDTFHYESWKMEVELLASKGLAHYLEF